MYSFELHPDRSTRQVIREIWDAIGAAKLCDIRRNGNAPHVTLAVAEELGPVERMMDFATAFAPIEAAFESVGEFPTGVLFLAPRLSPELEEIHGRFHEQFDLAPGRPSHYYSPGAWTPHCTLATQLTPVAMIEARKICEDLKLPLVGRFERFVAVRWPMAREEWRCALMGTTLPIPNAKSTIEDSRSGDAS
jgi:2'-5' RNA ligase